MKIYIKNISDTRHAFIVDPSTSICQFRRNVAKKALNCNPTDLVLAFECQVLDDQKVIADYCFKENDQIIYFISKRFQSVFPQHVRKPKKAHKPPADEKRKDSSLHEPNDLEDQVAMLVDMGFEKDKCLQALKWAKYNVDHAVEYFVGIEAREKISQSIPNPVVPEQPEISEVNKLHKPLVFEVKPDELKAPVVEPSKSKVHVVKPAAVSDESKVPEARPIITKPLEDKPFVPKIPEDEPDGLKVPKGKSTTSKPLEAKPFVPKVHEVEPDERKVKPNIQFARDAEPKLIIDEDEESKAKLPRPPPTTSKPTDEEASDAAQPDKPAPSNPAPDRPKSAVLYPSSEEVKEDDLEDIDSDFIPEESEQPPSAPIDPKEIIGSLLDTDVFLEFREFSRKNHQLVDNFVFKALPTQDLKLSNYLAKHIDIFRGIIFDDLDSSI